MYSQTSQRLPPPTNEEIAKISKFMHPYNPLKKADLNTHLWKANEFDDDQMFRLLLKAGADINYIQDNKNEPYYGCSVMHRLIAIKYRYYKVNGGHNLLAVLNRIKWMLIAGFDVNAKDEVFESCFGIAIAVQSEEIATLFINSGYDIHRIWKKNGTALHSACNIFTEELIQLILDKGGDISAVGGEHMSTPLLAAIFNQKISDEFLLKLIPPLNSIDTQWGLKGQTFLSAACIMQRKILIKELVARGAKQKNIPIIMYQKISTDIKSFLSMVTSTPQLKAAIKIANYLIASNNAHHQLKSLTPEALHILKEAIIDGLCVSGMIDHLTDEKDIQIIQLRLALINAIQAGILQCIKNSSFNVGEIVTVISQAVSLWKEKKALEELSEESVSDLPPQQAGTSRAGLFNGFNTSLVIQQTFFAHAQLKQSPMAVSTPSSCQTNPYRN